VLLAKSKIWTTPQACLRHPPCSTKFIADILFNLFIKDQYYKAAYETYQADCNNTNGGDDHVLSLAVQIRIISI
jgi:hypothetical protein